MSYAGGRVVHDADSHVMEHPDWLLRHVDPPMRERLGPLALGGFEPLIEAGEATHGDVQRRSAARDLAAGELLVRKNWDALGAFDRTDRSRALDLLGFRSQLVFSSFCHPSLVRHPSLPAAAYDDDLLYVAATAHNRAIAEFCADDERLLAVAFVPLDDPARAVAVAADALDNGCSGVELPSYLSGDVSIAHPDLDPLYRLLEQRGSPILFHVGGGGHLVPAPFERPGRPRPIRQRERQMAEPALTFIGMPAPVEMALAALVLEGVFEQHPALMCGVIEQGASWMPGFLRRLDLAFDRFAHAEQRRRLTMAPSDYVLRQVRVAPFPFEDLGWLFEQTSAALYVFGSDYPHDEGGPDPLGAFAASLASRTEVEADSFLRANFEQLMGASLPASRRTGS